MMFDNSKDKIREEREFWPGFRIFSHGRSSGATGGRPIVKFYGETKNSQKAYKYLSGYSPVVGDKVIMAKIGGTHVILGKVVGRLTQNVILNLKFRRPCRQMLHLRQGDYGEAKRRLR